MEYWHGGLVEQKLKFWGKWQPLNKAFTKAGVRENIVMGDSRLKVSVKNSVYCVCDVRMVQRKGKEGRIFFGCNTFPRCRETKSI